MSITKSELSGLCLVSALQQYDVACITPFALRHKFTGEWIEVPCGKCPECRKRRISGWSFRLMQEFKVSHSAYFITLTYDTVHVPLSRSGYMTLNKKQCQDFFKRLRHYDTIEESQLPIKYYLCGEYGGQTNRPHYHIILFNVKSLASITKAWQYGSFHMGEVNVKSVGYTLKYLDKEKRIPMHRNDDRIPEFSLMSKGLGSNYLTPQMVQYHKADLVNRVCCTLEDQKKIAMPRYYKDKIYSESQRSQIASWGRYVSERDLEKRRQDDPDHDRNVIESHKQKFLNAGKNAAKRNKV